MPRLLPSLATALAALSFAAQARAEAAWSQDFEASKKEAASSHRDLLIDFTGSDWCGPCIALHKTVLSTDVFEAGVKDKFVLVQLDYPKDETKLSPATVKQNAALKQAYGTPGYPTVMLCDEGGLPYAAMVGFGKTEPDAYVAHLDELRAKRGVRDQALATARAASGEEKARLLAAALVATGLDESILYSSYGAVLEEMKQADPTDAAGLIKQATSKAALAHFQSGLGSFMEAPGIHSIRQIGDVPGALAFTNEVIASGQLQPAELTHVMCVRASRILSTATPDEALASLGDAKEDGLNEASKKELQQTRTMLEARKKAAEVKKEKEAAAAAAKKDEPAANP